MRDKQVDWKFVKNQLIGMRGIENSFNEISFAGGIMRVVENREAKVCLCLMNKTHFNQFLVILMLTI